jgi:uncharacterized protein (UPF0147 family)
MDSVSISTPFLLFAITERMIAQAGGAVADPFDRPIKNLLAEKYRSLTGMDESSQRWQAFEKAFEAAQAKFLETSRDQANAQVTLGVFSALGDYARIDHEWLESLSGKLEKLSLVGVAPDVETLVNLCMTALKKQGVQAPARADMIDMTRTFIAVLRDRLFAEPAYHKLTHDDGLWERLKMNSDARERYIAQIIRRYQDLDFGNLPRFAERSLRIQDIFVDIHCEAEAQPDLHAFKERARKYQSEHERRSVGKDRPEKTTRLLSFHQALAENFNLVFLGDSGTGKTTLLKYITLAFAEGRPERLGLGENRLPIFVHLYDYAVRRAERGNDSFSLINYLNLSANESLQLDLPPNFFANALENGDCCICLDGLNEIREIGLRRELAAAITSFANQYPRNRYIVASRLAGYGDAPLNPRDFARQTIQPFNAGEIHAFIEKWYRLTEKDIPTRQQYIAHLDETIFGQERIKLLATNPLLLTVMALVHHIDAELPHERIRLYEKCTTALVENWGDFSGAKYNLRRRLLEKLAYWMHTQSGILAVGALELQLRHFLANDPKLQLDDDQVQREVDGFLALVRTSGGLLVERSAGIYVFAHLAFQEFLAACDIEKRLAHNSEALWNEIKPRLHDADWREVILLLLGSLNRFEQHNTELLGRIYHNTDAYEPILHRCLFLAARALADHVEVEAGLRNAILDSLLALAASRELAGWDAFAPLGTLREDRRAALGLLALANNEKAIVGIRLFAAQSLGQLGLADEESRILLGLAHDEKVHADVRSTATLALGQLGHASEIVVDGLLALAQDEKTYPYVRSDAAQSLGRLGHADRNVLDGLLALTQDKEGNERVRRAAAQALGRLKHSDSAVVNGLLALAKDETVDHGVRSAAVQALGRLENTGETILSGLLALSQDEKMDAGVRCDAADALGELGWVDHAARVMLALASDKNVSFWVRNDAASVLGRLGRVAEAGTILLELLCDENVDARVRSDAADLLGRLGHVDEPILQGLLALSQDTKVDARLRSDAAQALGELGREDEAIGVLLTLASDQDAGFWLRSDAAVALGELGQRDEAATILLELAHDEKVNSGGRSAAVNALGQLSHANKAVLSGLLALARDPQMDAGVRSDAAQALGQLGAADEAVFSGLLALVQDQKVDPGVRSEAAQSLGQLHQADQTVVNGLLGLVRDEKVDAWVRIDAAQALTKLGNADESVLTGLLGLVHDEKMGISLRSAAYHTLKAALGEGQ